MKIDQSFLDPYVGGIMLARIVCFEPGPDWYYLFKSETTEIACGNDDLVINEKILPNNRYQANEWISHSYDPINRILDWESIKIKILNEGSVYIKVDHVCDLIIYTKGFDDFDINPFRDFPAGHESMAGLGMLDGF